MGCNHERLRTVGDRVFCCACNEELTLDFLMNRNTSGNDKNRANNTGADAGTSKTSPRKRTTKKTV